MNNDLKKSQIMQHNNVLLNTILSKKFNWFKKIELEDIKYGGARGQKNFINPVGKIFVDSEWGYKQWREYHYSTPLPASDEELSFGEIIGGDISQEIQNEFKLVFSLVTGEYTPKYMSFSWLEVYFVDSNKNDYLKENSDIAFNKLKNYLVGLFPELTKLKRKNKMEGRYDGIHQPKFTTFYYYDDEVWFIEYDDKDIFSSAKWDVNDKLETFWSLLGDDELFEKLIKDVCDIDLYDKWGKKYNWQFDDMSETLLPSNIRESIIKVLKEESKSVKCKCGWSWKLSEGGDDPYICHKCGRDNSKKIHESDNERKSHLIEKLLNKTFIKEHSDIICKVDVKHPDERKVLEGQPKYKSYSLTITFIGGYGTKYWPRTMRVNNKYDELMNEAWAIVHDYTNTACDIYSKYVKKCEE